MKDLFVGLKEKLGIIIGVIIGLIIILTSLSYVILNIGILVGFGYIGYYFQNNKEKVKTTLKNWIDKI